MNIDGENTHKWIPDLGGRDPLSLFLSCSIDHLHTSIMEECQCRPVFVDHSHLLNVLHRHTTDRWFCTSELIRAYYKPDYRDGQWMENSNFKGSASNCSQSVADEAESPVYPVPGRHSHPCPHRKRGRCWKQCAQSSSEN